VREKAARFEEEQRREAEVQQDFAALVDRTVGSGERGHVLLVDTDAWSVTAAVRALASAGFAVTVLGDGPPALAITRTSTFDCLLLARDLPSISGLEVVKVLRQREAAKQATRPGAQGAGAFHLPVVAFTGNTEPEDLRLYMEAGMDGCVSKPLDLAALLNTMAAAIPVPAAQGGTAGGTQQRAVPAPAATQSVPLKQQPLQVQLKGGATSNSAAPLASFSLPRVETQQAPRQAPMAAWQTPAAASSELHPFVAGGGGGGALAREELDESVTVQQMQQAGNTGLRGARAMAQARRGGAAAPPSAAEMQQQAALSEEPPAVAAAPKAKGKSKPPRPAAAGAANSQDTGGFAATRLDSDPAQTRLPVGSSIPGVQPPAMQGTRIAVGALPLPAVASKEDEDGSHLGIFQLDAETAIPYCVMGQRRPGVPLFHFVVVGDIFDTYEQYQILFRKIVTKLPGLRVLLFNYPGQAFTEFRRDIILNNEYCAGVLQALMTYLGPGGTREFDLDGDRAPFYLVGAGNGGAIASYFASAYGASHPNIRALVTLNGFAHVDAHLAGVLHDAMNVFACSPPTRPDLPVYFFARFLFSPQYLQKVGAPLALNLYTAVSNPITLQGRIALCQGALSHVDCRGALESMTVPMVIVASSKDGFVKPSHVAAMVEARGGEVRSVKRALSERARAVVIWLRCGHELLQEARKPMVNLFEQLAVGYHEKNDVAFLPLVPDDATGVGGAAAGGMSGLALDAIESAKARAATMASQTAALQNMNLANAAAAASLDPFKPVPGGRAPQQLFEDKFLDNVVTTMRSTAIKSSYPANAADAAAGGHSVLVGGPPRLPEGPVAQYADVPEGLEDEIDVPPEVMRFARAGETRGSGASQGGVRRTSGSAAALSKLSEEERKKKLNSGLLLDPKMSAFERRDKEFNEGKSRGNSVAGYANQDVQEYMSWRVRRNKRRLMRIEACAVSIQRAWRSYLARTLVHRMRQQRAALDLQRWWRGCLAREVAKEQKKELWAARVVQRYWRGHQGRGVTERLKAEQRGASMIQRNWRGYRARKFMHVIKNLRRTAVVKIQAAWRRFLATRETWLKRDLRNAAINVQRVWRGYLGRARAAKERDRYLFSKSQAQGIEFGRQMLMEHKLHGTKLQSEVTLLTKEKIATEEKIEAVLAEISSFEQGVRSLEREMVELARAEAEAAGTLDQEGKLELRENKIRLDREFAAMLVKIADRRETLTTLEGKLQTIDRARLAKREELKDLERKLVVLLETQQQELVSIRQRQERRSENVVEDAVTAVTKALQDKDGGPAGQAYLLGNGGAGASTMMLADGTMRSTVQGGGGGAGGTMIAGGGAAGGFGGPTPQQRAEAQALMASTETMMKFGFMSMSLTYFSSLNMVRAMRQMGTANTMLASNPMLALIGQMGAAASGGGNPAAVALAATGGMGGGSMGGLGGMMSGGPQQMMLGNGTMAGAGGPQQLALMAATQSSAGAANLANSLGGGTAAATNFTPALRAGQMPGQEAPEVNLWTVGDVSTWLETLALGQYRDSFADAAIDGGFLAELTDDDLRNTLGIEHALHRKKILTSVLKLRVAEEERKKAKAAAKLGLSPLGGATLGAGMAAGAGAGAMPGLANTSMTGFAGAGGAGGASALGASGSVVNGLQAKLGGFSSSNELGLVHAENAAAALKQKADAGALKLDELMSWTRHNKGKLLADALAVLPDGRFDLSLVVSPFVPGYGTQYIDMLNGPAFHINKADDNGNSLLLVAAQNGRQKLAQVLIRKGANPNHQNAAGNTAMHYAMSYKFHELASWLVDPEKGGASDAILNEDGKGPYD
jgi:CheY-like chemotaxis protein